MGLFNNIMSRDKTTSSQDSLHRSVDYTMLDKQVAERQLAETGLRGRKLLGLFICIIILWIISIATFICNVVILIVLRMNHKGMESMQFSRTANGQQAVRFTARRTYFDDVVPKSGLISSAGNSKFEIRASQIQLVNKGKRRSSPATSGASSSITLEKDHIRVDGVDEFYIADPATSNIIFEASKPVFKLEKSLKMISSNSIKTNKVRAPIDQHLSIDVEKLIFKGNEGNYFSGRNVFFRALNNLWLKTGGKGSMTISSKKGVRLSAPGQMKVSNSPHVSANVMGKKICACESTGKLFVVQGNKPCAINPAYCF